MSIRIGDSFFNKAGFPGVIVDQDKKIALIKLIAILKQSDKHLDTFI